EGTEGRRDEGTEGRRDEGTEGRRDEGQETVRSFRALRPSDLEPEDRWILARLRHAIERIDSRYATYQLNDVAAALYDFFWGDFCDWYLELVKPRLFKRNPPPSQGGARGGSPGDVAPRDDASARVARQVLVFVLDQSLRLMHPVLPFISEALWQQLNQRAPRRGLFELADTAADEPALIKAAWPDAARVPADPQVEREIAALQNVIRALRDSLARVNTSRSAAKQPAIGKLPAAVIRAEAGLAERLADQQAVLERLGRCEKVEIGVEITKPPDSATQVLPGVEVYVPVAGLMDLAAERKRLGKELEEVRGHIERLAAKLANAGFTAKAPAAVVLQERARLAELQDRIVSLERNMAELS
ncbi:MAG: class I tRNA ligase family protein, partial [Planctomycetota bacterium]